MSMPDGGGPADGAVLFGRQCGTCHANVQGAANRQGPNLYGVVGRKAGSQPGFQYSAGFAKADFVWDAAHLGPWLTNPQAVIPGTVMLYRQARPGVRQAIIQYLTDQSSGGQK